MPQAVCRIKMSTSFQAQMESLLFHGGRNYAVKSCVVIWRLFDSKDLSNTTVSAQNSLVEVQLK